MVEVVIVAAVAFGLAIYAVITCVTELSRMRREIAVLREALMQINGGVSAENTVRDRSFTTVTRFAGNDLIRSWWLGKQGQKQPREEE